MGLGCYIIHYTACCYLRFLFFFFKQKTAYEMRISDWSSDVCSSDLEPLAGEPVEDGAAASEMPAAGAPLRVPAGSVLLAQVQGGDGPPSLEVGDSIQPFENFAHEAYRLEQDRKSTRLNSSH